MDPITAAILSLVLLFVLRGAVDVVIFIALAGIGSLIAAATDTAWPAILGVVLGWLGVVAWTIISIAWIIGDIIRIIQLVGAK